jgi:hypothetical protein
MQICPNKNCKLNAGVMPFVIQETVQQLNIADEEVEIIRNKCKHCNLIWTNVNVYSLTLSKSEVEAQMAAIGYDWGTIKGVPPL